MVVGVVGVFMPSSTLANEASDFLSVANQLAASPSPAPAVFFLLFFLSLLLFVFHSGCLIKHDHDYSFCAVLTLCMTMQSGSER